MPGKFDPSKYDTVKTRKDLFRKDHPDGRIVVELVHNGDNHTVFKSSVFLNDKDHCANIPFATGYAEEFKGVGGFANKECWFENCEESATGRALDNAGYHGNGSCSVEEMNKATKDKDASEVIKDRIGAIDNMEQAALAGEYLDGLQEQLQTVKDNMKGGK